MAGFEDLGVDKRLVKAITEMGYKEPTPIQEKCISCIIKGDDCVAQSSTGSGKTAAFGLPILQKIDRGKGLQFAVLTPTRELCVQVKDALSQFSAYLNLRIAAIYGGASMNAQIRELHGAEVMVGTPGRVLDHLKRGTMKMGSVRWLVLDEADRMLDMGFINDVEKIMSYMPGARQTMLFSATIPPEIRKVIGKYLKNPVYVKTEAYVDKGHLRQVYYLLKQEAKFSLLVHLLKAKSDGFALVFCATRRHVDALTRNLKMQGIEAIPIHGGLPQAKRLRAIELLKQSNIRVLVATDVAARGLDIRNITHIFNFDVPKTASEYIHRIGRTARAGAEGDAITLVTPADEDYFRDILEDSSLMIEEAKAGDHERLPYKAKPGGSRRGRPEGVSRTGKTKSDFSNTHPRGGSSRVFQRKSSSIPPKNRYQTKPTRQDIEARKKMESMQAAGGEHVRNETTHPGTNQNHPLSQNRPSSQNPPYQGPKPGGNPGRKNRKQRRMEKRQGKNSF